jgi:DinB superfamily
MTARSRLESAIERLKFSRQFTSQFLAGIADGEWFWHPSELTTHLAWQIGHLAVAEYNLCLRRIRGRTEADEALISDNYIECFKLGSTPVADPAKYPPVSDIQRVFAAVHERALAELAGRTDAELDVPVEQPHPVFKTKLGSIEWCSQHEMVHAGQIALLRRLMGKPPLR